MAYQDQLEWDTFVRLERARLDRARAAAGAHTSSANGSSEGSSDPLQQPFSSLFSTVSATTPPSGLIRAVAADELPPHAVRTLLNALALQRHLLRDTRPDEARPPSRSEAELP